MKINLNLNEIVFYHFFNNGPQMNSNGITFYFLLDEIQLNEYFFIFKNNEIKNQLSYINLPCINR